MPVVVVASTNPVKVKAAQLGFAKMFPNLKFAFRTVSVTSGVSDQPMTNAETLRGALNRAYNAHLADQLADYWVGIEGGIEELHGEMLAFAWIVVFTPQCTGKGRTGTFFLPPAIAELIRQGKELGEADDIVFGKTNSKQANGAIGILTGDVIDRTRLYEHAVILALAPFKQPALYQVKR